MTATKWNEQYILCYTMLLVCDCETANYLLDNQPCTFCYNCYFFFVRSIRKAGLALRVLVSLPLDLQ